MKTAVFLPNWIGDAVMATPALSALRRHYAGAHFVGVMRPYVAGALEGGPWFDQILFTGGGPWSQSVPAVARDLRGMKIDLAVLFPNSFRSALTAWLGRCRQRIGYARYGRSPLLTKRLQPILDKRGRLRPSPVLDAYNLLAEAANCPAPTRQMELFTTPRDEAAADQVWRQSGLLDYPEIISLNPGAAFGAAKHWPSDYFTTLAKNFVKQRNSGVLILCGPHERDLARRIAAAARHPAIHSLADYPLSLGLTKACVKRCDLLVTTDSGPRHFAAAFGRRVVTLFGPTHIAWTETFHPHAVNLQRKVDCGPCQLRVCPLDHRCMKQLTPADVYGASIRLLSKPLFEDSAESISDAARGPNAHDVA
jgi:heptosyltransferase II